MTGDSKAYSDAYAGVQNARVNIEKAHELIAKIPDHVICNGNKVAKNIHKAKDSCQALIDELEETLQAAKSLYQECHHAVYVRGSEDPSPPKKKFSQSRDTQPRPAPAKASASKVDLLRLERFDKISVTKNPHHKSCVYFEGTGPNIDALEGLHVDLLIIYLRDYYMEIILWNRDRNPHNKHRINGKEPGKSNRGIGFLSREAEKVSQGEIVTYNNSQAGLLIAIMNAVGMLQKDGILHDNYHNFDDLVADMDPEWVEEEVRKAALEKRRIIIR